MISHERLTAIADWARALPEAEVERARRGVVERDVAAGAYLCRRGDRMDFWAGVISGLFKLGTMLECGKEVTYAGLPSGMWFGEGSLIKNEPRRYDVIALRPARVAFLQKATFDWLCAESIVFNRYLVRHLNERLGHFIALAELDRSMDATGRIAFNLALLFNPNLRAMAVTSLEITQEELGLLAGVSRQAANKAVLRLEAEGLICREGQSLRLIDLGRLRRFGH